MANTFKLEIVTPRKQVYQGEVLSLQIPAYEGSMGILAYHAPLLAELVPGEMDIVLPDGKREIFNITGGFIEVKKNHAIILADAVESADEIDISRAEAARERARKRLEKETESKERQIDLERAEFALRRSLARLRVAYKMRKNKG